MNYNPYLLSDKTIKLLNKKAVKRFRETQRQAALLDFDELYVIRTVTALYQSLDADNRKAYLDLARMIYSRAWKLALLHKRAKRDAEERQIEEEITELWLLDFLDSYNEVTRYRYSMEVIRKRNYTIEAINSVPDKAKEFTRGLMHWSRFSAEYSDLVTDAATLQAFKDTGVKRVRWVTEQDEKVCKYCRPLDGKVFDIDKVPRKQHWHCRCWLTPAD